MYQYIIIKGSEWLYNRLDVIGYSLSYEELMKKYGNMTEACQKNY